MKYIFLLKGKVKPYVRMTQRGKFVKKEAIAYLNSKDALAQQFVQQMMGKVLFYKRPLKVEITIQVKDALHRCDLDNQVKAILDSMNGIVFSDDRWVDWLTVYRVRNDNKEPKAIVIVELLEV